MSDVGEMRIALTGATGGLGTTLALAARSRGDEVTALVRDPAKAAELERAGVKLVRGDLDDDAALDATARGASVFVHAAAHVGDWGDPMTFERVNVGGTRHCVEAAARENVKRFVHVSSVAVYGRPAEGIIDETYAARACGGAYEDTKLEAERIAFTLGAGLGLEVSAVRPPVIFGPHDRVFLPRLVKQLRARMAVLIDGGLSPFNVVDAADVVDVILRCAEQRGAVGEAFNVAAAPPPAFRDVLGAVADAADVPRPRLSVPRGVAMTLARVMDDAWRIVDAKSPPPLTPFVVTLLTRNVTYDASKARRVLGWTGGHDPLGAIGRAVIAHTDALTVPKRDPA
jgi:nucleoside-diphosphate-sugar epimerase